MSKVLKNGSIHNGHKGSQEEKAKDPINAFTMMMANRHKQDEIIQAHQEETDIGDSDSDNFISSADSDVKKNNIERKRISSNIKFLKKTGDLPLKSMNINAFEYLMCNKNQNTFSDEQNSDLSPVKNKKTKKKVKKLKSDIKFIHNSASSGDSLDSCEVEKHNRIEPLLKIQKDRNTEANVNSIYESLNSQSDLKLGLINENEYFDIEETFKEEILECVSKKKKKKKRVKLKKIASKPDSGEENLKNELLKSQKCEELLLNSSNDEDEGNIVVVSECKNGVISKNINLLNQEEIDEQQCQKIQAANNQPGIKSFFKFIVKNELPKGELPLNSANYTNLSQDEVVDKKECKEGNENRIDVEICSKLSGSLNKLSKASKNHQPSSSYKKDACVNIKNRASCLKLKTKSLRQIRKKHQNIDKKIASKETECTIIGNSSPQKENRFENHENKLCEEASVRRSSRAKKSINYFDIFSEESDEKKLKLLNLDDCSIDNLSGDISKSNKSKNLDKKPCSLKRKKRNRKVDKSETELVSETSHNVKTKSTNLKKDISEVQVITLDDLSPTADTKKIAPIFMQKKILAPLISPTKLKARAEFLFSDVSEASKKTTKKSTEEQILPCPFPKYNHIKQEDGLESHWKLLEPKISQLKDEIEDPIQTVTNPFEGFTRVASTGQAHFNSSGSLTPFPPLNAPTVCHILSYLKNRDKSFPVMAIYNSFRQSKEDYYNFYEKECNKEIKDGQKILVTKNNISSRQLKENSPKMNKVKRKRVKGLRRNKRRKLSDNDFGGNDHYDDKSYSVGYRWVPYDWTLVFAPKSLRFVIGNKGPVNTLKEWLFKWKTTYKPESSDEDSSDTYKESCINALLVTGTSGIGKTAIVYAAAHDLGYKILEVNASSARQGKQLMSQLSEATQSHSVSSVHSSASSFEHVCTELQTNADKLKPMSLILIEDIDIVFEEADEGFWSAVNTLLATSKRPIIMTSSQNAVCVAPKIKETSYLKLELTPPDPTVIAKYLQLLCLANGVYPCVKEIEFLVRGHNQDIRKSILDLQFWVLSGTCQVQWWKIDNDIKLNHDEDPGEECDISLLELFPFVEEMTLKSVNIPISLGCTWSKRDTRLLREHKPWPDSESYFSWPLLSSNCNTLLPFVKREIKLEKKYPLKKDDSAIKNTSLYQKYNWLSLDSDSDTENKPQNETLETNIKRQNIPKNIELTSRKCVHNLDRYFNSLADCDILSSTSRFVNKELDANEFRDHWWTPSILPGLESDNTKSSFHSHNLELNLIPELANLALANIRKNVLKMMNSSKVSEDEASPLCVDISQSSSPQLILQSHCRLSQSKRMCYEDLNKALSSELPCFTEPNRCSIAMDYLPFLREFARCDQIGEAIQKYKRSRRFLKYFNQLGIYSITPSQLISMCNTFQSG